MHLAATILIVAPLVLVSLVGLVYLLAPRQLSYHRKIIQSLGEAELVEQLRKLSNACFVGVGAILVLIGYGAHAADELRGMFDHPVRTVDSSSS